jgi:hypothetical protein
MQMCECTSDNKLWGSESIEGIQEAFRLGSG